jgi:hypothetical protein
MSCVWAASFFYIHCLVPSICSMALTDFQADPSNYWDSNFCFNGDPEFYYISPLPADQELVKKCQLTWALTQCKFCPRRFRSTLCMIQLISGLVSHNCWTIKRPLIFCCCSVLPSLIVTSSLQTSTPTGLTARTLPHPFSPQTIAPHSTSHPPS